jgi:hypothetical protein
VPVAFTTAARALRAEREGRGHDPAARDAVGEVRRACRDRFRETGLLAKLIPSIEEVLAAGELKPPKAPPEAQPIAIPAQAPSGDVGHRG